MITQASTNVTTPCYLIYSSSWVYSYSDENLPDAVNVDIGISVSLIVAIAVVIGSTNTYYWSRLLQKVSPD